MCYVFILYGFLTDTQPQVLCRTEELSGLARKKMSSSFPSTALCNLIKFPPGLGLLYTHVRFVFFSLRLRSTSSHCGSLMPLFGKVQPLARGTQVQVDGCIMSVRLSRYNE